MEIYSGVARYSWVWGLPLRLRELFFTVRRRKIKFAAKNMGFISKILADNATRVSLFGLDGTGSAYIFFFLAKRLQTVANAKLKFQLAKQSWKRSRPRAPISSISTLKPASIEKLKRFRSSIQSDGGKVERRSVDEPLEQQQLETAGSYASTSAELSPEKKAAYEKLASVWAKPMRTWKKPYSCLNCRKEFVEPLGYFIHLVNRFCYGNRGILQSSYCPLCNEAVKTAPSMLDHVRRRHCGLEGLRVDRSVRIEFPELASEIIGFNHICTTCGRGFHSSTRCNTAKPHVGTKVPLQEVSLSGQFLYLWSLFSLF